MFNVGGGELLVIFLIALIVLGPDKLPGAARQAGKFVGEFRRMSQGFQQELRDAMDLGPEVKSITGSPTAAPAVPAVPAFPVDSTAVSPESSAGSPEGSASRTSSGTSSGADTPGAAAPSVAPTSQSSAAFKVDGPSGSFS
jgi:sec-independent protein translocase protein TatB